MKKRYFIIFLITCFLVIMPIKISAAYSCPDGYQLTADTCTKTAKAYQRNGTYYCDPTTQKGATLDLDTKQCVWTRKADGTDDSDNNDDSLACNDGYLKTEGTCLKIVSSAYQRDGQYYCPQEGTKLIGTSCVVYETTSQAEDRRNAENTTNNNSNSQGTEVTGCEVVPEVVRKWINISLNVVKYMALVLVIVLGVLDFIKAAGAGEPDSMKKAGQSFIKRLVAVIILFLLPMIIELILNLINLYGANQNCF